MTIFPEYFVIWLDPQTWKEQSFYLTTGTEGITQLLTLNFEQPKCKWSHLCHTFGKHILTKFKFNLPHYSYSSL